MASQEDITVPLNIKYYVEIDGEMEEICPDCGHSGGKNGCWCVCYIKNTIWKEYMENKTKECKSCPKCDEEWQPKERCICKNPMCIVIPVGQHVHIDCPVHGDTKVYSLTSTFWVNNKPSPPSPWDHDKSTIWDYTV